ncbi:MAG TPA: ATP-binding protein [Stellaceae bacterium]|nr:ATP-binding protein [Stellaceae bacterium]
MASQLERSIRAEQLRLLLRSPTPMIGSFITAVLVALLLWRDLDHRLVLGWAGALSLWTAIRGASWAAFQRRERSDEAVLALAVPVVLSLAISGFFWGLLFYALYAAPTPEVQLVVLVFIACMITGGAINYAAYLPAHDAFLSACILPMVVIAYRAGTRGSLMMCGALLIYNVLMMITARSSNRTIASMIRLQRENLALVGELRGAKEAAEHASRAKSEFVAAMSHELRTPLNAILGFSEVIRDALFQPLAAQYRDYAGDIHRAGQHLLRLINDVLDLSKIEAAHFTLYEETASLGEMVDDCSRLVAARAHARGIALELGIPADLPPIVVDRVRFKQIVLNLLSNAVKFSRDGGSVRVTAALAPAGGLLLRVADNGIGMEPKDIPVALAPFQQVSSGFSRHHEGTGLGLPLANKLTELHGGTLEVESAPGVGTTVTVRLPEERLVRPQRSRQLSVVSAQ